MALKDDLDALQRSDIWRQMLSGEIYDAAHSDLRRGLMMCRRLVRKYNDLSPDDSSALDATLRDLLGSCGKNAIVNQPFRCDWGVNIHVGDNFFANFNLTILDEATVSIGDNVFIGPNVSIYTACHPLDAPTRNTLAEWSDPVTIGNDCWICGGVTICPGVNIGDGCVIGAGSVVTKNIPSGVVWAGNPARFIKSATKID